MTTRRGFISKLSLGAVGAMFIESCAKASKPMSIAALPTNIIYSEAQPGKWQGKAGSHVPVVTIDRTQGAIDMETKHGMAQEHYIVRHTLVFLAARCCTPIRFHPRMKRRRVVSN
ncbi:MAG: hypothetical protein R3C68_10340 [Myxococcota bacterium]